MEPTDARVHRIEAQARRMFARVLSQWAMDVMALKSNGLILPGERPGSLDFCTPAWGETAPAGPLPWSGATAPQWRPTRRAA